MALYTKESLDQLRAQVDLVEVISSYVPLKRAGAVHKGLCPFHEEKTPSFGVQAGDSHYHCFGCGAHGDAIAFLMNHEKMSFVDSVDWLAERFGVQLEKEEGGEQRKGPDRTKMKGALELACELYHNLLLHTKQGHEALHYLYRRGIDLEFIRFFRIGFSLPDRDAFQKVAKGEGYSEEILRGAGLITDRGRDFFSERIIFPITDPFGSVIGFSGRKIREETFGGKYINTPETPLFKKSNVLFGLSYCRREIAKSQKAIIVEGQIDALRLIHEGFNYAVAGQGTAFGADHVKILEALGVKEVFLAMDGDDAGSAAAIKIGDLFQKKGISVSVVPLPEKSDPDTFVKTHGKQAFQELLDRSTDYLPFAVSEMSKGVNLQVPAEKNRLIQKLSDQIRGWDTPVMVHESLRRLAQLTAVPESVVGVGASPRPMGMKRLGFAGKHVVDPDQILETDLLRWLLLTTDERLISIILGNVAKDLFLHPVCLRIFLAFTDLHEKGEPCDLISLGSILEKEEEQKVLAEIVQKKVNLEKAEEGIVEVIHRLLIRRWMEEREAIKTKIQSGQCSDEEALQLAKAFDEIKKNQPTVVMP